MKNNFLLEIVVCPICYSKLSTNLKGTVLICSVDNVVFPIKQGIPVLLREAARNFNQNGS